ncbi:MAG TPA: HD domain-containing phosphohydrolase [Solirubrobacteraceae bacterium]|nr:HD domain-containing phosphohydrolase [Solirubrobacteraceae bacterium]
MPTTPPRFTRQAAPAPVGIAAFARLLNLRDGYSARHSDRVAALAVATGRQLRLAPDAAVRLQTASTVFDIGKIGVPDRILRKTEPLDEQEWTVMRCHAAWGAEALATVPGLEEVATVVRFHHERWDGRGYPDGLAGEDIPIESRIIGVADAYCSMTSDRPYRGALSPQRARSLLAGDAVGGHFDPRVLEATLAALDADPALVRPLGAPAEELGAAAGPPEEPIEAAAATAGLHAALSSVRLPALAETRARMLRLLDQQHPPLGKVADLVETDPGLAAAVMRAAIRDGASAVAVPAAVEALPTAALVAEAKRVPVFDFFEQVAGSRVVPERFRLHAVAAQRAARRIASILDRKDADTLAAAALLHDVGKLVLVTTHPSYPAGVHGRARTPDERIRAERRALGLDHASVGALLLRRWGFPEDFTAAVAHHHHEGHGDAATILRLADMLAHYSGGTPVDPERMLVAAQELGLSAADLRAGMYDLHAPASGRPERPQPNPLSDRQVDVLRALATGKTYREIAEDTGLATSTVRSHLHAIYERLGVSDRAQAVLLSTERGWL